MFNIKYDKTLNSLYEEIQKSSEPTIEDLIKDIKENPKKFVEYVLKRENLNEFVTKYIENVEKDDADLAIFATVLSQMINKCKEEESKKGEEE